MQLIISQISCKDLFGIKSGRHHTSEEDYEDNLLNQPMGKAMKILTGQPDIQSKKARKVLTGESEVVEL